MNRNKGKHIIIFILLFSFIIIFFLFIDIRALPIIKDIASAQAENIAQNVIENSIIEVLSKSDYTYSDLVNIEKDVDGRISVIKADTVKINRLKSEISSEISKDILDLDSRKIKIPIGTIIGTSFLSGKGPRISIDVTLASNINSEIINLFTSAGINQTLHEIYVKIDAQIFVVIPGTKTCADVKTNFCIAQTVIIGSVPDSFANLQKNNS